MRYCDHRRRDNRAGSVAWWHGQPISAAIFGIDGQAAGFAIAASAAPLDLCNLVRQGRIGARADLDDDGAVAGVTLFLAGTVSATTWRAGLDPSLVPYEAQPWFDDYSFARIRAQLVGFSDPPRPAGAGQPLQLELIGEITEQKAKALVHQVRGAVGRSLILTINSSGGFVEPAMAIYDELAAHPHHVQTLIIGKAMSAAGVIAMAGDRRTISPSGVIMFHAPALTSADSISAPAMRAVAGKMDQVSGKMVRIVANRAAVPLTRAQGWLTAETRFDAAAAVRAGICHEVVLRAKTNSVGPPEFAAPHTGTAAAAAAWRQRMRARLGDAIR